MKVSLPKLATVAKVTERPRGPHCDPATFWTASWNEMFATSLSRESALKSLAEVIERETLGSDEIEKATEGSESIEAEV